MLQLRGFKMEKQGKIEWLEILFWVVMIILFIMILTRVFGNSATEIQIFLGFVTGFMIIMGFIAKHHREIGEIKINMKHSFAKAKEDMDRMERKIDSLLNRNRKKNNKTFSFP